MVLFLGPFPPPISGQTLADDGLCSVLEQRMPVDRLRTERLDSSSKFFNAAVKLWRHAKLTVKLQKTGESILFVSVERGRGKLLQRLLIQASRQRFDAIIFVYHIWDGFDLGERFRSIALEHSDRILHVGLCDRHADKLRSVIRSHDRESVMALSLSLIHI